MTAMNVIPFRRDTMEIAVSNDFEWRRDLIYREICKIFSGHAIDLVDESVFHNYHVVRIEALKLTFVASHVLDKSFLEMKMLVNSLPVEDLPKYVDYKDWDYAYDEADKSYKFIRVMASWRIKNGGALL